MKLKKVFALLVVVILAFTCLTITAFAAEQPTIAFVRNSEAPTIYANQKIEDYKIGIMNSENFGISVHGIELVLYDANETVLKRFTPIDFRDVEAIDLTFTLEDGLPAGHYRIAEVIYDMGGMLIVHAGVVDYRFDVWETLDSTDNSSDKDINYAADVTTDYADVKKVQVSWTIPDITASVTINKTWNTETLTWDTESTTDSAGSATAEFNFVNLSSTTVNVAVSFTAEAKFENSYTKSYTAGGVQNSNVMRLNCVIPDRVNNMEGIDKSVDHGGEIDYTITPKSGTFKDLDASVTTPEKFGTYTVFISANPIITYDLARCTGADSNPTFYTANDKEVTLKFTIREGNDKSGNAELSFYNTTVDQYKTTFVLYVGTQMVVIPNTNTIDGYTYPNSTKDDPKTFYITIDDINTRFGGKNVTIADAETLNTCLAKGTKITMADGSKKNVENIVEGDEVLTFNHEKGIYEGQKVYLAWACEAPARAFTLNFTNEISISVIGDHCFFEKESLSYATVLESNAEDFVGHHFYNAAEGRYEELLSVTYGEEPVEYYEIYTEYNANCIAEDLLNVAMDSVEMLNIYKFNEDLTVDLETLQADIDAYGLYEYPADAAYPEEYLEFYAWKYMNIIVGKGFVTWEDFDARREAFLAE